MSGHVSKFGHRDDGPDQGAAAGCTCWLKSSRNDYSYAVAATAQIQTRLAASCGEMGALGREAVHLCFVPIFQPHQLSQGNFSLLLVYMRARQCKIMNFVSFDIYFVKPHGSTTPKRFATAHESLAPAPLPTHTAPVSSIIPAYVSTARPCSTCDRCHRSWPLQPASVSF